MSTRHLLFEAQCPLLGHQASLLLPFLHSGAKGITGGGENGLVEGGQGRLVSHPHLLHLRLGEGREGGRKRGREEGRVVRIQRFEG